jgi:hypothetical protein
MRDVSDIPPRSSRENAIKKTPGMQKSAPNISGAGWKKGRKYKKPHGRKSEEKKKKR